jgi:hypothetical protein
MQMVPFTTSSNPESMQMVPFTTSSNPESMQMLPLTALATTSLPHESTLRDRPSRSRCILFSLNAGANMSIKHHQQAPMAIEHDQQTMTRQAHLLLLLQQLRKVSATDKLDRGLILPLLVLKRTIEQ